MEEKVSPQISKKIKQSLSGSTTTASQSVEFITAAAVSQTQQLNNFYNVSSGKIFQNPKATYVKKLTIPTLTDASKLTTTQPSATTVLLKNKQIAPIQSDLDTSNNLTSSSLNKSKLAQTMPKTVNGMLPEYKNLVDTLDNAFNFNQKSLVKHLLFVQKCQHLGNVELMNDGIAKQQHKINSLTLPLPQKTTTNLSQHHITSSNSGKPLLQKSTNCINQILRPNPDKLLLNQTLSKIDVDINNSKTKTISSNAVKKRVVVNDDCRELKTVKNINFLPAMVNNDKNHTHLTSSPHISTKTSKYINRLPIVTKSNISKTSRNNSCQVLSTIATTSTSVISNITPITVATSPMMTNTINLCRVTPKMSSTNNNAVTANCVTQQFVKIAPKNVILKETMNSCNGKRLYFMKSKHSKTDSKTPKFVPIFPKLYLPTP